MCIRDRLSPAGAERVPDHAGWSRALEDRERDVQHVEESGLPVRAQFWAWPAESVGRVCDVDDVGVSGRSNAAVVLSLVPGGLEETGRQKDAVGAYAIVLSGVHRPFDARNFCSSVLRLREAATGLRN